MNEYKYKLLKDALQENKEFPLRLLDVLKILPDSANLIDRVVELFKYSFVIKLHDTQTQIRDYRFKYLFLSNYRKFSPLTGDVHYYGLPFCSKEGDIHSLFLLGDNGSGKSSLFNSMEYVMTGKIGEASYRNIQDLTWYVNRTWGKDPEIRLQTQTGEFALSDAKSFFEDTGLNVERFFFSENSIYELSRCMVRIDVNTQVIDWVPFFCYALGINDIMDFVLGSGLYAEIKQKLEQLKTVMPENLESEEKEIEELILDSSLTLSNSARDEVISLDAKLKNYLEDMNGKESLLKIVEELQEQLPQDITYIDSINRFRNQLDVFKQNLQKQEAEVEHAEEPFKKKAKKTVVGSDINIEITQETIRAEVVNLSKSLERTLKYNTSHTLPLKEIFAKVQDYFPKKQILDSKQDGIVIDDLIRQLEQVHDALKSSLSALLQEYLDADFKQLIEDTLKPFIEDTESLKIEKVESGAVLSDFGIQISVNDVSVNKYFNTFRFRLFSLCLLSAFNFKAMKQGKFLFPFVFDDIFYANDYKNKTLLYRFFEVLSQGAKTFLGNENCLQLIFFTHDEQFMNTLFLKKAPFASATMARLLDCRYVKSWFNGNISADGGVRYYPVLSEFKRNKR